MRRRRRRIYAHGLADCDDNNYVIEIIKTKLYARDVNAAAATATTERGRSRFLFDGARDEKGYTHYIMCQQPPRQKDCRWGGGGTEKN